MARPNQRTPWPPRSISPPVLPSRFALSPRSRADSSTSRPRSDQAPTEVVDEHPVRVLVRASMDADIVVVGSRGLHGLKSLGSVSERVAHQAACSVLVVRSAERLMEARAVHALSAREVARALDSDTDAGLTAAAAAERLARYGAEPTTAPAAAALPAPAAQRAPRPARTPARRRDRRFGRDRRRRRRHRRSPPCSS